MEMIYIEIEIRMNNIKVELINLNKILFINNIF